MAKKYQYSCGCSFELNDKNGLIFNPDINSINLDCSRTWNLISDGNTKGCFQLESRLGRSIAKKLKPENIEQLSALIAVLRPGCIAGDTKISTRTYIHTDGRIRYNNVPIRLIAKNPNRYKTILSYNENTGKFIANNLLNVFYTGDKECFRVVLNTQESISSSFGNKQYKLECTDDHKLLTSSGWKELKNIKIGERILVNKRESTRKYYNKKSFRHWCYHTYEYRCIFCDWNLGSLDVNHIKGNRFSDNHPDNLCFLCPNHHRQFSEGTISCEDIYVARSKCILPISKDGKWATLKEKISVGIKDVYDITMSSPHHNFIAGGVIVHNCLEALRDDKSVTNHYIDKKNGQETLDNFHPSLEPILNSTYGEMIYQEQAMEIAKVVAGFNLLEADMLRKAIGKKKPEEMAKVKSKFLEGSSSLGIINDNEAEQIFGWIEKSQRYSFNKSILEETVVVTESGEKTIKDLNIGEKILSPVISDDNVYKNEYVEVINKYDHGEQEVFKITLDNGNHITCTMEHKFLCSDNEVHPLSEILLNNLEIMCIT